MGEQVKEDGLRKAEGGEEDTGQRRRGSKGGLRRETKGIRDRERKGGERKGKLADGGGRFERDEERGKERGEMEGWMTGCVWERRESHCSGSLS